MFWAIMIWIAFQKKISCNTHLIQEMQIKKTYYSFDVRNIRFIVLDANFNEDGTPYDSGNFDWTQAYLPKEQLEWLSLELKKDDKYVVVFIHQLLDSFSDIYESVCVKKMQMK